MASTFTFTASSGTRSFTASRFCGAIDIQKDARHARYHRNSRQCAFPNQHCSLNPVSYLVVNGVVHGPAAVRPWPVAHTLVLRTTTHYFWNHGPPSRSRYCKDLIVNRSSSDRTIGTGGYIRAPTGSTTDGNAILFPKPESHMAMSVAACIGCGSPVAA